jgi:hypothetical protein
MIRKDGIEWKAMWRSLFLLLVLIPPLAIIWKHDTISLLLMITWMVLIVPLCILHAIDNLRSGQPGQPEWFKKLVRFFVAFFGLISLLMGLTIIGWCLYNVAVKRLPEYSGPGTPIELWLGGFGIAVPLISFGIFLIRLALQRGTRERQPSFEE